MSENREKVPSQVLRAQGDTFSIYSDINQRKAANPTAEKLQPANVKMLKPHLCF